MHVFGLGGAGVARACPVTPDRKAPAATCGAAAAAAAARPAAAAATAAHNPSAITAQQLPRPSAHGPGRLHRRCRRSSSSPRTEPECGAVRSH
eukprot:gene24609-biopygen10447